MTITTATFVSQLSLDKQEQIREDVTSALTARHAFSDEALEDAMNSRLSDLEELLDVKAYL